MEKLLSRFENSILSLGIMQSISEAERVIVAFSGGADSRFLLELAVRYFSSLGVCVEAAHLNHMIRGDEADRDEDFCRSIADELGIRLHVKRVDIPALAENGGSVEEIARRERYAFFEQLMTLSSKKTAVLTAHNADDNMETVIFNMLRGSGGRGMCGIPPVRDGKYFRPLLSFTSSEIREACREHKLSYVNDSTNFETEYTRNYIRNKLTPLLTQIVPNPETAVLRMSESLRRDDDFIRGIAEDFLYENESSRIEVSRLTELHDAVLSRVLIMMHSEFTEGHAGRPHLERKHVEDIIRHLRGDRRRFSVSVPGNVRFTSDSTKVFFELDREIPEKERDNSEIILSPEVPVTRNGYTVVLTNDIDRIYRENNENIYNLSIFNGVKFDKIKGKLKVRARMSGDTVYYGGMSRKVKKLYSERKLPLKVRVALPIVLDDEGIVWIPGFPPRDGVRDETSADTYSLVAFSTCEELEI